jgi:hypothetical protein
MATPIHVGEELIAIIHEKTLNFSAIDLEEKFLRLTRGHFADPCDFDGRDLEHDNLLFLHGLLFL